MPGYVQQLSPTQAAIYASAAPKQPLKVSGTLFLKRKYNLNHFIFFN